ncbi:MAG: penicillin-binding protein 2 [Burkholderiales bacterium]|nr:penicillin-binding protein 2 [Burkholderiales bacterium]
MRKVEIRDHRREMYSFRLRLSASAGFILFFFFLLVARFIYLQIIQHEHFQTLAENNRISIIPIAPNRGLILDRNGVVLARNYSAYTLEITPSKVKNLNRTIDALSKYIEIAPADRKRFKRLLEESHDFESLPIRTRLSDEEVARFAVNSFRFPGIEINARLFRQYTEGELISPFIGYIGRINDNDLEKIDSAGDTSNYKGTDYIGKMGIEQSFEKKLHGTTGFDQVEVDSSGRAVRTLSRASPTSGDTITLTIDSKLQEIAKSAFGDYRGALIAIDPNNGEILAFVSKPGFDPNLFVEGIDSQSWQDLNNSPDKPLVNRALRGEYPPGSTFKPFMALAGLQLKARSPQDTISDPGYFALPGKTHHYRDWKPGGHGTVDLHKSIVVSCDTYYYGLANLLGIDKIHDFLGQFGFGKKTGIDIGGELSGNLPSAQWKQKRYKQPWYAGDTIPVGIGQGYDLTTPLQLAFATAILASNGTAYRPHLIGTIRDSKTGKIEKSPSPFLYKLDIDPEYMADVRSAMIDVTKPGGTAATVGTGAPYEIAGKTGTAQVIAIKQGEKYVASRIQERYRDHALFIAYAPADHPKIALAVLVENGGHGGSTAGPIARQVMDYYLLKKLPKNMVTQEKTDAPAD